MEQAEKGEKFFHRARSRFHYYRGTYHQPNFEKQKKNKKFPITIILSPILLISYLLLITKRNPFDRSQMNVHLQNYNFKTLKKCIKLFSRQQTTSSLVLSNFMKKFIFNFHFFMLIFLQGLKEMYFIVYKNKTCACGIINAFKNKLKIKSFQKTIIATCIRLQ